MIPARKIVVNMGEGRLGEKLGLPTSLMLIVAKQPRVDPPVIFLQRSIWWCVHSKAC
jgi:hypothetical protein